MALRHQQSEIKMSFLKSLSLAILATIFLTYVFGTSMLALMDLNIMLDGEAIEPFKAIGFAALVVMLLVVLALAIVLSVFGSLIFVGLVLVGSIVMVTIGIFWPILLVAAVIWLVSGEETTKQYA
jgi:hypothetical protein